MNQETQAMNQETQAMNQETQAMNQETQAMNQAALEADVQTATNTRALLLITRMQAIPFTKPHHHTMWDTLNGQLEDIVKDHHPELLPDTVRLIEMGDY